MELWSEISSIIGVGVGLGGLLCGLYQYWIAQKWKKSEFAASIVEKLVDDPKLALACQMLDYERRKMIYPEEFQKITGTIFFEHNWESLRIGLATEDTIYEFDWQQTLYRDVFDHLFIFLDKVNGYISINLIDINDVVGLKYWINQIEHPRFSENDIFTKFIKYYGYDGVDEIIFRFKRAYN